MRLIYYCQGICALAKLLLIISLFYMVLCWSLLGVSLSHGKKIIIARGPKTILQYFWESNPGEINLVKNGQFSEGEQAY